jgi:hypothetical protein
MAIGAAPSFAESLRKLLRATRKGEALMSLAGILSSNLFQFNAPKAQDRMQQFRLDFQQLGQDLQTGNLTGARADFAAVQKDGPQSSSSRQNSNPIAQTFQQADQRPAIRKSDRAAQQD